METSGQNALSRQRILDAALEEFSARGCEGASLNEAWAEMCPLFSFSHR